MFEQRTKNRIEDPAQIEIIGNSQFVAKVSMDGPYKVHILFSLAAADEQLNLSGNYFTFSEFTTLVQLT